DRVEVLKGPQGTLYGASSVGGLVKYVTKRPDHSRARGEFLTELSSARGGANYNVSGAVNLPVMRDRVAIRASGFEAHGGGVIDNIAPRFEEANYDSSDLYGGRLDVLLTPTPKLDVRVVTFFQEVTRDGLTMTTSDANGKPVFGSLYEAKAYGEDGVN